MADIRPINFTATATESDLNSDNFLWLDTPQKAKKLPGDAIAPKSVQDKLDNIVTRVSSAGMYEKTGYFSYINRSMNTSTGEVGVEDRSDRVCTPTFMQILHAAPFVILADSGYSFVVYAYSTNAPLTYIGKTDRITRINSEDLKTLFSGIVLFRIVAMADDDSSVDASTFNAIHYIVDGVLLGAEYSENKNKELAIDSCGFANYSLGALDGRIWGYNKKRLSTAIMSAYSFNAISADQEYEYNAFLFDENMNFLAQTHFISGRANIAMIKNGAGQPNARYVRFTVRKEADGEYVDLDPLTDGKRIKITSWARRSYHIDFERGGISEYDGKFLRSSTTSDSDNSTGFSGHWRNGLLISTTSKTAYFVFDSSLVTNLNLFEFDQYYNLLALKSITAFTEYSLEQGTRYVRVSCSSMDSPSVDILLEDSSVKFSKNYDEPYKEISYIYEVAGNCGRDVYADDSTITQYANNNYFYNSLTFKLPPNYSPTGKPVPVVFFCHGSGAMNSRTDTSMGKSYQPYLDYLNAEGYAVLDCFSTSSKFPITGQALHNSNLDNMACIASAIKWFSDNYNVEKDVYFMCKSRGGNAALAACYQSAYKVKACGLLAPSISIFSRTCIFSYDSQGRMNFAVDMGFENVGNIDVTSLNYPSPEHPTANAKAYVRGNWKKLIGVCSTFLGFPGSTTEEMVNQLVDYDYADPIFETTPKDLPVPTKVWIAIDDDRVSYSEVLKWQKCVQLGHGMAVVRTMPSNTGRHHAVDTDANALKASSIVTSLGFTLTDVPLAYVELVRWFRQFE